VTPPNGVAKRTWVLAGPAAALAHLAPMIEAHRRRRPVRLVVWPQPIDPYLEDAAAIVLVGTARGTPGRSLPGVFLRSKGGAQIPVGWLPDVGERLASYALTAAEVQGRVDRDSPGPCVLLGELDPRAGDTVAQVAAALPAGIETFRWTSERVSCPTLIEALRCGPGVAFYFGHAVADGWAGYGGFGRACAARAAGRPLGAVLSISCSTASRPRRGLSFCEEAVLSGLCAAALGGVRPTLHRQNVGLGLALARTLAQSSPATLADLILSVRPPAGALDRYRMIGDPLALLTGARRSVAAARSVFAPAPDDPLPVVPLSAWGADPASEHPVSRDRATAW
jgi:hypothetical protein